MPWISQERCPRCGPQGDGAGDNLATYSDGHKFCFACGYFVPSPKILSLDDVRNSKQKREEANEPIRVFLPDDFTTIIPTEPLGWLYDYGITPEEIAKLKMGWSALMRRLIFPIYDGEGKLLMWQGRYFPPSFETAVKRAKYYTCGQPDGVEAYFGHEERVNTWVLVVEDFISAVKVGRIAPTCCLWGSELSIKKLKRLAHSFESLIIWLDHDKASYQAKSIVKAKPYFKHVTGIFTKSDPKAFTTKEISEWIQSSLLATEKRQ